MPNSSILLYLFYLEPVNDGTDLYILADHPALELHTICDRSTFFHGFFVFDVPFNLLLSTRHHSLACLTFQDSRKLGSALRTENSPILCLSLDAKAIQPWIRIAAGELVADFFGGYRFSVFLSAC